MKRALETALTETTSCLAHVNSMIAAEDGRCRKLSEELKIVTEQLMQTERELLTVLGGEDLDGLNFLKM